MQSSEQLMSEVQFWRDFIQWWESKHDRAVPGRMIAALADAEKRHRLACSVRPGGLSLGSRKYIH